MRALLAILLTIIPALAQSEHPISGRRIAGVMGMGGADWLERSEREVEEMPETAIDRLGLKPGMVVADIGAGVGYMTIRVARRLLPDGRVFAVDVQPEMLTILKNRAAKAKVNNVIPVLGSETDPHLAPGSCNLILMVDVYHELSQPQRMLRRMRDALKPDGRLILLEYRREDPHIPIRSEHKMTVGEARMELEAEGFHFDKVLNDLPRQHILIFSKVKEKDRATAPVPSTSN